MHHKISVKLDRCNSSLHALDYNPDIDENGKANLEKICKSKQYVNRCKEVVFAVNMKWVLLKTVGQFHLHHTNIQENYCCSY